MKTHFGAIVFAAIMTGAIEAHVSRPTLLVFMPFTALVYGLCFLFLTVVVVLLSKTIRSDRVAGRVMDIGCSLVFAAVLANWVQALWGVKFWPMFACGVAGVAWYYLHEYVGRVFAWPPRAFIAIFALLLVAVLACQYAEKREEQRQLAALPAASESAPNVLVIIVDTLRADHLGVYGYGRPTSPNIDAMAKQGVLFKDAVAASSWTLPSHTSMLTGRYPHEHGATTVKSVYSGHSPLLAQYMQAHGYRTAAFSANTFFFTRRAGLGPGFAHFSDDASTVKLMLSTNRFVNTVRALVLKVGLRPDLLGRKTATDINREALHWIQSTSSAHPFFVVLNYLDVHDPYRPPDSAVKKFARGPLKPKYLSASDNYFPEMTDSDWEQTKDLYDSGIYSIDQQVAQLTAQLNGAGILENTILVFTSDHGESFGKHGVGLHGTSLYEPQTHVPLLIRWPGHVPAGVNIAQPVSTASLAATIAHLATGHSDPSFELPPLDALWTAPAPASWPSPMSELAPLPLDPRSRNHDTPLRSITTAKWYCVVGDGRIEVFNPADEAVGVNAFRNDPVLRTFLEMDRLDKPPADASHVAQAQPDSRSATNR